MQTEIVMKNVTKRYGKKLALDHLSLKIPQGMFGLLGPNGLPPFFRPQKGKSGCVGQTFPASGRSTG